MHNASSIALFWAKVDRSGGNDSCWMWTAYANRKGYGQVKIGGKAEGAHRVAYRISVGEIPKGLTIDHVCKKPGCCNPHHLQAVPISENVRRSLGHPTRLAQKAKTHCPHGHEYSDVNTYVDKRGSRQCKTCVRDSTKRYRDRKRGRPANEYNRRNRPLPRYILDGTHAEQGRDPRQRS